MSPRRSPPAVDARTAPSADLDSVRLRRLVDDTVDASVDEPLGAYLFASHERGSEIGRHVERTVFLEAFGNTPELLEKEYGPYEEASVFFCVVDHRRRQPAGVMRVILPGGAGPGLKSLNDVEPTWGFPGSMLLRRAGASAPLDATWDIATLAVMPEYRGNAAAGLVSVALYQSEVLAALAAGVDWMVAILDETVHRMARLEFSQPFVPFAPARSYLGSPASLPVYVQLSEWSERLASGHPAVHDVIFRGSGIEAAVRPLDLERSSRIVGTRGAEVEDGGRRTA